jgi:nucleoside-diphosphate-sugar epimerase
LNATSNIMRTLVTGGSGFIGSHLVDRLLKDSRQVRCLVRRSSNRRWLDGKPVEIFECDSVNDPAALCDAVRDVDVVFHVLGTLVAPNLNGFREINVEPVRLLLEACQNQVSMKRFVLASSHGAAGPTLDPQAKLTETDPCHPVSAYGRSKLEAEEVTRQYLGKVPFTILRLSAVYGPRDVNLLKIFRSAHRKGTIPQIGREEKALCLAYVSDIVSGMISAANTERALNETYFLASEENYSFQAVATALSAVMNREVHVRLVPNIVVKGMMLYADFLSKVLHRDILLNRDRLTTLSCPRWVCDVAKAKEHLHYRQSITLADGFRETFDWYRQEGLL